MDIVNGISFVEEDKSQFVLGSESGGVFKCSMNSKASAPTGKISFPISVWVTWSIVISCDEIFRVRAFESLKSK